MSLRENKLKHTNNLPRVLHFCLENVEAIMLLGVDDEVSPDLMLLDVVNWSLYSFFKISRY